MRRGVLLCLAIGVLAAAGWVVLAGAGTEVMPSYLAGWLFWMAVPLGALPLVMLLEGLGDPEWIILPVLRRVLWLLPAGAVLALPILFRTGPVFRRAGIAQPLPPGWMAPGFFIGRTVVILVVLSVLAVVFAVPSARGPRRTLAGIGLFVHVCLVSIAAIDWVLALQPGLGSSAIGLLLVASQMSVAVSLAALVVALATRGGRMQAELGRVLAVVLGVWAFLHFVQYLVVWSANLPDEIVWYQARTPGFGGFILWFACIASLIGLVVLPSALGRIPAVLATVACMLLVMHLAETYWLVTPAFRGRFTIGLADVLAALGIGGLLVALLLTAIPREFMEVRHANR